MQTNKYEALMIQFYWGIEWFDYIPHVAGLCNPISPVISANISDFEKGTELEDANIMVLCTDRKRKIMSNYVR